MSKIIFSILIIIFISAINEIHNLKKEYMPLNIIFDFSNYIQENPSLRFKVISQFESIKNYFNSLIEVKENIITERSLNMPSISGIYFNTRNISKFLYKTTSIFIFIKSKNFVNKNSLFAYETEKQIINSRPLMSVITANNNTDYLKTKFNTEQGINFIKWNIIRVNLNIIGMYEKLDNKIEIFNLINMLDYIGKHYNSYNSYKKFLDLTKNLINKKNYKKPNKKINMVIQRLPDINYLNDIMKDNFNENISDLSSISEITINSFNDYSNYKIKKCDLEIIANNCFRFDKKCVKLMNNKKYFMEYSIDDKNNKVICYLNTNENLLNKKCGYKYGYLIDNGIFEKKITYNYLLYNITNVTSIESILDYNNIPDFELYDSQKIYLYKPSSLCPKKHPRTLYFIDPDSIDYQSQLQNSSIDIVIIKDPKFYMVYGRSPAPLPMKNILNINNFIQSSQTWNNFNIFLCRPNFNSFYIDNINKHPLNKYQVFSCFKNNSIDKKELYNSYSKMKKKFPKDYGYMPESYFYPEEKEFIINKFKNYEIEDISTENLKDNLWLYKPIGSSHALGIDFFKNIEELKNKITQKLIITKYISNPLLINNKKFDIKSYLLVTGINPLKLYFYNEGLINFATEKYSLNNKTLNNPYIHLANPGKNMRNKVKYKKPSYISDDNSNDWKFEFFERYCKKNNIDFIEIKNQIKDIMIKTFIPISEDIYKNKKFYAKKNYQIIEFDFIIDENLKLYLMEIDTDPKLSYDHIIKTYLINHLIIDSLNIVGVVPYAHNSSNELFDKD